MEKNKIEFYKREETYHREMRKVLPPVLQLKFPSKTNWSFEGELSQLKKHKNQKIGYFFGIFRIQGCIRSTSILSLRISKN